MNDDAKRTEVPYGTLDLILLKTLSAMGPLHGYRIARRLEQISGGAFDLNQGSIYPALTRLVQKGWVQTEWGKSDTGRRVKFYDLTAAGAQQLELEVEKWQETTSLVARFLEVAS